MSDLRARVNPCYVFGMTLTLSVNLNDMITVVPTEYGVELLRAQCSEPIVAGQPYTNAAWIIFSALAPSFGPSGRPAIEDQRFKVSLR